jgi:hypothetical protein
MSNPTNRTALREDENRSAPPSQLHNASAVSGPTPRAPAGADPRPAGYRRAVIQSSDLSCPLAWLERVPESSRLRRMMVRPRGIMHPVRAS